MKLLLILLLLFSPASLEPNSPANGVDEAIFDDWLLDLESDKDDLLFSGSLVEVEDEDLLSYNWLIEDRVQLDEKISAIELWFNYYFRPR